MEKAYMYYAGMDKTDIPFFILTKVPVSEDKLETIKGKLIEETEGYVLIYENDIRANKDDSTKDLYNRAYDLFADYCLKNDLELVGQKLI